MSAIKQVLDFAENSELKSLYDAIKHAVELRTYYRMNYLGGSQWDHIYEAPLDIKCFSTSCLKSIPNCHTVQWTDLADLHKYMGSGDYVGSSLDRANRKYFLDKYGDVDGVFKVYGDFGYDSVAVRLDALTPEMVEDLAGLESYPSFDDDVLCSVETEMEEDDWDSWIEHDLKRELRKIDQDDEDLDKAIDGADSDGLFNFYVERKEKTNTYWSAESATSGTVDIEGLVKGLTAAEFITSIEIHNAQAIKWREEREAREAGKRESEAENV